jgi:hypothetical protein
LNSAIAVSENGAKKMLPPYGLAPNAIPCDDFFPTNFTGNSFPTGKGPARSAFVDIENILKMVVFDLFFFLLHTSFVHSLELPVSRKKKRNCREFKRRLKFGANCKNYCANF